MIDIHCHLLPDIDDGPANWDESLAMAELAVADGTRSIIATPHQLGNYRRNQGPTIRQRVDELRARLQQARIELEVYPGADVRIEPDLLSLLKTGDVLTLADQGRHVLLELPHELYFPLEPLLEQLERASIVGILSHPERNRGIQADPSIWESLVDAGCLMQVTAGSLLGTFGDGPRRLSERMLQRGTIHFIASDGHSPRSRRPVLQAAYEQVTQWTDTSTADDLFTHHPQRVLQGATVPAGRREVSRSGPTKRSWFSFARRSTSPTPGRRR